MLGRKRCWLRDEHLKRIPDEIVLVCRLTGVLSSVLHFRIFYPQFASFKKGYQNIIFKLLFNSSGPFLDPTTLSSWSNKRTVTVGSPMARHRITSSSPSSMTTSSCGISIGPQMFPAFLAFRKHVRVSSERSEINFESSIHVFRQEQLSSTPSKRIDLKLGE